MGKIAVAPDSISLRSEGRGPLKQVLAHGEGWSVCHVVCSAGPCDHAYEECFSETCIAIVTSGSFQYRSSTGCELMTPGSLLLGNAGQLFECGHDHALGDRCIAFTYQRRYFNSLAAEAGSTRSDARFFAMRLPPLRELSGVVTRASALANSRRPKRIEATHSLPFIGGTDWEEISAELARLVVEVERVGERPRSRRSPAEEATVTRIARLIASEPFAEHSLESLAAEVKLSRYHFLRVFRRVTGITPHKFILRTRLRHAARRFMLEPTRILDVAFDSGFGDLSNFNHAFRAEYGMSPKCYRETYAVPPSQIKLP